jgi:hypothetical protein
MQIGPVRAPEPEDELGAPMGDDIDFSLAGVRDAVKNVKRFGPKSAKAWKDMKDAIKAKDIDKIKRLLNNGFNPGKLYFSKDGKDNAIEYAKRLNKTQGGYDEVMKTLRDAYHAPLGFGAPMGNDYDSDGVPDYIDAPVGVDIESWSGMKDYAKNKMSRLKKLVQDDWAAMKAAIKQGDFKTIIRLVEKKDFNLLEEHESKGQRVRALEYAISRNARADITQYLAERTRLQAAAR